MGAAGAAVEADGVLGEQSVGSADMGQVRPDVDIGLGHGESAMSGRPESVWNRLRLASRGNRAP